MEEVNSVENYMYETTVVETKQGIQIQEMLYKKITADMTMTSVKVIYIPQGRNRYRRGRASRATQTTTTTIQIGQARFIHAIETTVTPSAQAALLQAMQNLTVRPQNARGPCQGMPRNARPEFTPSSRARQGAIPRPASTKVLRSSKTTMIKNGPRTTISSEQTAVYRSGRNTTVCTGEAVVTRDMRAPPPLRTLVMTGGSQFTFTASPAPPAWRN